MDVPIDITIEILSRLPVKSLMRFKCVSISFYNLISNDPFFRKKHLHHQSSLKKLIIVPPFYGAICGFHIFFSSVVSLSPELGDVRVDMIRLKIPSEKVRQVRVHNSCDGLLCMSTSDGGDVVICNPSTRQVSKFQGCVLPRKGIDIVYSLAHDPRSNVYKLLGVAMYCQITYNGQNKYKAYFYSTDTGMWSYIEDSSRTHTCNYVEYCGKTTVVNGAFHWLGGNEQHKTPHVVVTLDISNETYGALALPQAMCDVLRAPILCEMKGKLCIMGHNTKNPSLNLDIWMMNEYGDVDSMVRMHSMSFGELSNKLSWPLHMLEDDTLVIYRSGNIYSYKDGRVLGIKRTRLNNTWLPCVYFESLISPQTFVPNGFSATMGRGSKHVVTKKQWPRWCLQ